MASQITACQRRKQFITSLKGANLYWLFVLVCSLRNGAGASGSFFLSFFSDFTLLFWLCFTDFSLLSARVWVWGRTLRHRRQFCRSS